MSFRDQQRWVHISQANISCTFIGTEFIAVALPHKQQIVRHSCHQFVQGQPLIFFPNTLHTMFVPISTVAAFEVCEPLLSPAEFMRTHAYPAAAQASVKAGGTVMCLLRKYGIPHKILRLYPVDRKRTRLNYSH